MFRGFRTDTKTMRTRSSCAAVAKAAYSKAAAVGFPQESSLARDGQARKFSHRRS
jgi:hypothetical protein